MPKVGVVIATYNRAHYIRDAIDSVLAQTYTDYEIIVVDDGSIDNTKEVLQVYGEKILYFYQNNQGQAAALNFGINQTKSEYIALLDDDDMWLPNKLELQIPVLENDPELGFVGTDMYLTNESGEITSRWGKDPSVPETFESLFEENILGAPSVVVRKRLFEEAGGFDASLRTTHDYDLWLRLAKISRFQCMSVPTVKWRMHGTNKSKNGIQKLKDRVRIITRPENMAHLSFLNKRIRIAKEYHNHAQDFQGMGRFGLASKNYFWSLLIYPFIGRYYFPPGANRLRSKLPYRVLRTYLKAFYCFLKALNLRRVGTKSTLLEQWSIGIYRLTLDNEKLILTDQKRINNPVLTSKTIRDQRTGFVADPFLIRENERFFMFFEVFKKDKASLGYAVSKDFKKWKYKKIVLDEPFHLSYPFVLKWNGKYFMVPESHQTNSIRLYEAVHFPDEWKFVKTILAGRDFVDPTLLDFQEKLWLFVSDITNGNLYLHFADSLEGNWQEHPQSPIIRNDQSKARPGGNVIRTNKKLIRIAQDCLKTYGHSVRAFEITKLTPLEYSEKELPESPLCAASGEGWNKDGMHHLSACPIRENEWVAAVDGKVINTVIASSHS